MHFAPPVHLGPTARQAFYALTPAQQERACEWLRRNARHSSPYRVVDALRWFAADVLDFRVVGSLTPFRGTPRAGRRPVEGAVVICRPAKGGQWGKSVEYRVLP